MQEKEGYVMNPKVKFSLMSFFSLAGFVGYIILLCNVKRIYAAGTAIGGFWVGLIACVILFDVLLHFAVRTGLEAFSGLKETKDKKAEEEAARKAAEEEARRKAEEEAARKAAEEAARKAAEEEARRKAEEEARRKAEKEARRKAEEEAARSEEEERARLAAILAAAESGDDDDDDDDDNDDDNDNDSVDEEITDAATGLKIVVHYRRSFMARLIQSQEKVQDYYTGLKNVLLSFEGVKSRVSWNYDSFNRGRKQLAKINIRGKSLMLYLALDPKEFEDTKYFFTDVSDKLKFAKVPMRIKVRSGRGFKHGVELIEEMMSRLGIERQEIYHPQDFHMPYETTQQLVDRGLIKVVNPAEEEKVDAAFVMENLSDFIRDEVSVAEADALFTDDVAKLAMKHVVRERTGNKKTFINLDTICEHFEDGATVNLAALKEKKLVPADIGRIKILARGRMTKQMTIEADDFSMQAIKMIILTGGEAVEVD